MVSKKQRFKTVILVIILAAAIVAGVFGISYAKGGVTFPWQVVATDTQEEETTTEPEEEVPQVIIKEPETTEPQIEVEEDEPEIDEEESQDDAEVTDSDIVTSGQHLDYYGALTVEDGNLVDSDGNTARLVGVSSHGLSWYPAFVTPEAIESLRDNWGINVIRLAMYTSDYNGYCVGGSDIQDSLKETIYDAIDAATDKDMYVIVDWHTLNDADPNEYKSEAIQFFGELVRKYENNDNIIYEICNEPNGDTTWADIRNYANEVIPVIRNVDDDAIILVGTPDYCSDLTSVLKRPLDFDNVMYTYHFYAGTHKSEARDELEAALEEGLPVFISEYGFVSADGDGSVATKEAEKWIQLMNEYQLSSCIWNLSNKDEGSALITADTENTYDFTYEELSDQGQYFIDVLSDYGKETLTESDTEEIEEEAQETTDTTSKKANSSSKNKSR